METSKDNQNRFSKEEQGPESAQATELKDNESEFQKQRFQRCLSEIQKSVSGYPVEWRPKLLEEALEQARRGKGATEKLIAMEEQVRIVCDNLDVETKAVLAVLSELSSVAGISDVGSYGTDLLSSTYRGKALVDEALQQNPGDTNLKILAEVFDLAKSINEAEGKIFRQEIAAEVKTTTTAQPQVAKPEDAEAGPNTGIKALDDFLESLSHEATAAAYGALRLVCVSDATGKKMREYLQRQVVLLEDPERVDDFAIDAQVLADIKWFLGFVRGAEIGLEEC